MARTTRPISWVSAARKEFESFPEGARSICLAALTIAAEGSKADIAKPLKGLGSGVMEIACPTVATPSGWSMQCSLARMCGSCTHFRRSRPKESRRRNTKSI